MERRPSAKDASPAGTTLRPSAPDRPREDGLRGARAKRALLWIAGARVVLSIAALPLAPFLYRRHFLVLVVLRPSQGVLLAGAVLARNGHISLLLMLIAALPLQLVIVWVYFLLGRAWQDDIDNDDQLPFLTARLLRPRQLRRLRRILRRRGMRLVLLARFAIFPTGLLAAAAGASDLPGRRFFPSDAAALAAATGVVVTAGYGLGVAQHRAGTWLIAAGVVGLVGLAAALTYYLVRGENDDVSCADRSGTDVDAAGAPEAEASTREEVLVDVDKDTIIHLLRQQGRHGDAETAARELPDKVDDVQHADLLSRIGIDPSDLLAKLPSGLGGKLGRFK